MSVMTTALRDSLKTLRPSGMLETLDARLTQAQKGELGTSTSFKSAARTRSPVVKASPLNDTLRRAKF